MTSTVYADQWETPEVHDLTLNDVEGACELSFSDTDGWEETIAFDSPETMRAWLTAVNKAVEWYLIGRGPQGPLDGLRDAVIDAIDDATDVQHPAAAADAVLDVLRKRGLAA